MQAPWFWTNPVNHPGLLSGALLPLAGLWHLVTQRKLRNGPWQKLSVPVICVGNINIGGTGKTPTVIALLDRLQGLGATAHVVSRGHGGSLQGPVKVDEKHHDASQVGDEPLLLSAFGHTWVARDRAAGAQAAIAAGADVILMDDGLQNPALVKDLSIVVVDAGVGFGNGRIVPAGPLREPVATGLSRADLVLAIGTAKDQQRFVDQWADQVSLPIVTGALQPLETGMDWRGQKFLAFAGIGRPEKFFATLRGLGADLVRTEALTDHQILTPRLLHRLEAQAESVSAQLVTTEKDAARLPKEFRSRVLTLPVRLKLETWELIDQKLKTLLADP